MRALINFSGQGQLIILLTLLIVMPFISISSTAQAVINEANQWRKDTYYKSNSGLPSNNVNALAVTTDGSLWVGTDSGLVQFKNGLWKIVYQNNDLLKGHISTLVSSADGSLWVGTLDGLVQINHDRLKTYDTENSALLDNRIISLALDSDGAIWVGTLSGGLAKLQDRVWQVFTEEKGNLPSNRINALAIAEDNTVSIGTDKGLVQFNQSNWTLFNVDNSSLPENSIYSLVNDNKGSLWVVMSGALATLDKGKWFIFPNAHDEDFTLPATHFPSIVTTSVGGAVWVAGILGYARWNENKWTVFEGEEDFWVSDLVTTGDGAVWIATNDGLIRRSKKQWVLFTSENSALPSNYVQSLSIDNDGSLLVAVSNSNIYKLHNDKWDLIKKIGVNNVSITRQGKMWIGANYFDYEGGLIALDLNSKKLNLYTKDNSLLPSNQVLALAIDKKEVIWIGTPKGLVQLHNEQWLVYNSQNSSLKKDLVSALAVGENGDLWIGLDDGELALFRNGHFHRGLNGQTIVSIKLL